MEQAKPPSGELWRRVASGIEAGVVGGLAMLVLLTCESLREDRVWWEIPNLLGSTFYGPRAFRTGPGMATVSGIALHLVITGTLGGLFGVFFGGIPQRGRLVLLGILAAAGWYTLANAAFWPRVNPWMPTTAGPAMAFSHLLLGACLGYMGRRQDVAPATTLSAPLFLARVPLPDPLDSSEPMEPRKIAAEAAGDAPAELESGLLVATANGGPGPEAALVGTPEAEPEDSRSFADSLTPLTQVEDPPAAAGPDGVE